MAGTKKLLLIHTGGTLGMDLKGDPSDDVAFLASLKKHAPSVFELADIRIQILFNKDSSNIRPVDWIELAACLHRNRNDYDGFVVVHGTDTMAFTASALSFMLANFGKPIVFTGSQKPLVDIRSDASRNLVHAVELAVQGQVREVCIFFDSLLLRGNRAKKTSIMSFGAFESPNMEPLAKVGVGVEYSPFPAPMPEGPYVFDPRIETRVAAIKLFPGIDSELFFPIIDERKIKGLILMGFGPGDLPLGEGSLVHFIRRLTESGIPSVVCSQAIYGRVDLNLYEPGRAAMRAGAISAHDMTFEAALTKAMCLLGRGLAMQPFHNQFVRSLAGELTELS